MVLLLELVQLLGVLALLLCLVLVQVEPLLVLVQAELVLWLQVESVQVLVPWLVLLALLV